MPHMGRGAADDGSNAVEFAIVLPVLVLLLFGMMYGGLALTEQQQINHAAREGARYGATLSPFDADQVASRVRTTGQGVIYGDDAYFCVAFSNGTTFTRTFYPFDPADTTLVTYDPGTDCPDLLVGDPGERVQVSMRVTAPIEAVFVSRDVLMGADAVSVYEPGSAP